MNIVRHSTDCAPRRRRGRSVAALLGLAVALAAGCGSGGGGGSAPAGAGSPPRFEDEPGVPPDEPFSSGAVLAAVSRETDVPLALLSIDHGTGALGLLPGSPLSIGASTWKQAAVELDESRRRLFVAADRGGAIAVHHVNAEGTPAPVAGSPFATERSVPRALALGEGATALYVGYESSQAISQYRVDPMTGALSLLAPPVSMGTTFAKALARSGSFLYAASFEGQAILGFRIEADGALTPLGRTDFTPARPADLRAAGGRLYAALCDCSGPAGVDAFAVDAETGALARLPGAPYVFPGTTNYNHVAVSPDGRRVAVAAGTPGSVAVFDAALDGSLSPRSEILMQSGSAGPRALAWSPDGRFLYACDSDIARGRAGIYVIEVAADGSLRPGVPPRYELPGGQVDIGVAAIGVEPGD